MRPTQLPGWNIDQLEYPTFHITLIAKIMDRLTVRYLADPGEMTYAEWRVLVRLATMEVGGTVRQVADLAWVDRAEVSRAASSLEAKGVVGRRENPQDRRKPVLFLTRRGRDLYRREVKRRQEFHENLLVGLSAAERQLLDDLLGRIGERLVGMTKTAGDA